MRHVNKTIAGFAALALILAACGDDDDDDGGAAAPTEAPATEAPATEAPATEAPATEAPATEAPETVPAEVTEAPGTTAAAGGGDVDALYQECLDNGAKVNLIALPDEWANYKGILQSFRDKFPGVENPVADPDASSADEMEAVQTLAGRRG